MKAAIPHRHPTHEKHQAAHKLVCLPLHSSVYGCPALRLLGVAILSLKTVNQPERKTTMYTQTSRQRRRADVNGRASIPNHMYAYCRVLGCTDPARAGTKDGLDTRYCRRHYEHYQRHGSHFKGGYTAKELAPYRKAALRWLKDHPENRWVHQAIGNIRQLYWKGGHHIPAFRLCGKNSRQPAWTHWARLRKAEIDAMRCVAAWLAMEIVILEDPQAVRSTEYKRVQAAKLVHRMASGTHKKWTHKWPDCSGTWVEEMNVYPRPRGRVLRHIGTDLDEACELIVDLHLEDILASKKERDETRKLT
jgi:hypothetical protein